MTRRKADFRRAGFYTGKSSSYLSKDNRSVHGPKTELNANRQQQKRAFFAT
jgi:hypothetical protein